MFPKTNFERQNIPQNDNNGQTQQFSYTVNDSCDEVILFPTWTLARGKGIELPLVELRHSAQRQ